MTSSRTDRDALVRGLLLESDLDPDDEILLGALHELHALGQGPVPLPSAEIATERAASGGRRRRLGRRGATVVVLIAAASLGTGLSAAASPDVRSGAQHAIEAIVHVVVPHAPGAGRGSGSHELPGAAHTGPRPSAVPTAMTTTGAPTAGVPGVPAPARAGGTAGKGVPSTGTRPARRRTPTHRAPAGPRSGGPHRHGTTPAPAALPHLDASNGKGAPSRG